MPPEASSDVAASSVVSTCPVCAASVPPPSLVAHVDACLNAPALPTSLDIPSPPPTPPPTPPPAAPPAPEPTRRVADWLAALGLAKYATGFLRAGYRALPDLLAAAPLSDHALRDACGVTTMGARKKILSELSALSRCAGGAGPASVEAGVKGEPQKVVAQKEVAQERGGGKLWGMFKRGGAAGEEAAQPKRKLWAIFEPGYRAVAASPKKRPRTAGAGQGEERGGRRPRKHAFSHRVPGTSFTVDSFYAAGNDPPGSLFFLSHFHSDHYGPLRKKTMPPGGRVLCSAVTASLVQSLLRVPKEAVRVLPLGKKVDVPEPGNASLGVSVWLYDANHCPGAVVFLFFVWQTKRYVLHTGDCRYDPAVFKKHDKLVEVVKRGELDYMHLDTTYCDPRYVFPYQANILEQVVHAAKQEDRRTKGRCLFFFGTYSIGKEKVFMAVADALNLKIFAGSRKRGILLQCNFGPRLSKRLTNTAGEARVQVVSMRALSADGLREYAERNNLNNSFIGRGLAVVFRPTGWTFRGDPSKPRRVNRTEDQAMLYEVAYSEHSSYEELRAFVAWSKPSRVIPTVNARSAEQANALRKLLGHTDSPLRSLT